MNSNYYLLQTNAISNDMKLSSKVCLLLSAYGAICILAFESAEARVMLPSTQLKGRDKLVEIVTKINENSKAAEAAHNIDVHDILVSDSLDFL